MELTENNFKEWLKVKGLSENSIKQYRFYLSKLNVQDLDQQIAMSFLTKYNNCVSRAFLKNFLYFLKVNGYPTDIDIPSRTGSKKVRIPKILTKEEVHKLASGMAKRDMLMVLICFYGGLRLSGLVHIKPYDFIWKDWFKASKEPIKLKVIEKKDKERIVILPSWVANKTYFWIKEFQARKLGSKDRPLFGIDKRRFGIILNEAGLKILGRKVNPHMLRHSCASYLFEKGLTEKEVADYLGHESTVTTQIYIHLNKAKLHNKINNAFG